MELSMLLSKYLVWSYMEIKHTNWDLVGIIDSGKQSVITYFLRSELFMKSQDEKF